MADSWGRATTDERIEKHLNRIATALEQMVPVCGKRVYSATYDVGTCSKPWWHEGECHNG